MLTNVQITKQIDDNNFVISVDPVNKNEPTRIVMAHDYAQITTNSVLFANAGLHIPFQGSLGIAANLIRVRASVQVSIRDFVHVALPYFNEHKYAKPKHFALREDGEKPYYGYTYYAGSVAYVNKQNVRMVAFRCINENVYNHVTEEFFNKFVKPNL